MGYLYAREYSRRLPSRSNAYRSCPFLLDRVTASGSDPTAKTPAMPEMPATAGQLDPWSGGSSSAGQNSRQRVMPPSSDAVRDNERTRDEASGGPAEAPTGSTRELIAALAVTEDALRTNALTPQQRHQLRTQQRVIVRELRRRRAVLRRH